MRLLKAGDMETIFVSARPATPSEYAVPVGPLPFSSCPVDSSTADTETTPELPISRYMLSALPVGENLQTTPLFFRFN
jgi:hypothetical protein